MGESEVTRWQSTRLKLNSDKSEIHHQIWKTVGSFILSYSSIKLIWPFIFDYSSIKLQVAAACRGLRRSDFVLKETKKTMLAIVLINHINTREFWFDLLSRLEGGKEGAEILSAWLTHQWGYRLWHNQKQERASRCCHKIVELFVWNKYMRSLTCIYLCGYRLWHNAAKCIQMMCFSLRKIHIWKMHWRVFLNRLCIPLHYHCAPLHPGFIWFIWIHQFSSVPLCLIYIYHLLASRLHG